MKSKFIAILLVACMAFSLSPAFAYNSGAKGESGKQAAAGSYSDVASTHWAHQYITTLNERGVLSGCRDGTFRPDRSATRAEAAKMLYLLLTRGGAVKPGTSGGGSSGGSDPSDEPCDSAIVTPNEAQGTVDSEGGVIEVADPDSPIYGARVEVPAGAVDPGTSVTLALSYEDELPGAIDSETTQTGKTLVLSKDTCCNFKLPVRVTMPWSEENLHYLDVPSVFYWEPQYGKYIAVGVKDIIRINKFAAIAPTNGLTGSSVTFTTVHGGKFAALAVPNLAEELQEETAPMNVGAAVFSGIDTHFTPADDGFVVRNFGSYKYPGGSSIGMANYAGWYFANKRDDEDSDSNLRHKIGADAATELASRAYLASSNMWAEGWMQSDNDLDDYETGYQLIQTMLITKAPQVIVMTGKRDAEDAEPTSGLAALVYAYDLNDMKFGVYDQLPGGERYALLGRLRRIYRV